MVKVFKILFKKRYFLLIVIAAIIAQTYFQLSLPSSQANIQRIILTASEDEMLTKVLIEGGWMLLYAFIILVCAAIQNYFASYCAAYVGKEMRRKVFSKVSEFSLTQYDKFGTSTLITRTTNDIEQVRNFVFFGIKTMILSPSYIVIALIKTIGIDPTLSLIIWIVIPIIIGGVILMLSLVTPLFKQIQTSIDNVTVILRENLTGIRVIRAYCQQNKETEKFEVANKKMTNVIIKSGKIMSLSSPFMEIVFNVAYIAIYALGFYLITNNTYSISESQTALGLKIADISEVSQYSLQVMQSFVMLAMILIQIPQALVSSKRINDILKTDTKFNKAEEKYGEDELNASGKYGEIEFKNVTFKYPVNDLPTLKNISFKTKKGSVTAIIGSTGSGKSTLINLIPRFYKVDEGEILLDGININELDEKILKDKIAFVPQTALLFKGSVKDNIKYGKKDASDEEVLNALEISQANHFVEKLEDGINGYVAQGGKNFSGGQKQRLCIARAIIKKAEVYVFDDSFSALDFKTDAKIRKALKENLKDATTIIVAQRVSSILDADNIIVLNEGEIVGEGTHIELLKNCETYRSIVRSQLDEEEVDKTINLLNNTNLLKERN